MCVPSHGVYVHGCCNCNVLYDLQENFGNQTTDKKVGKTSGEELKHTINSTSQKKENFWNVSTKLDYNNLYLFQYYSQFGNNK